MAQLVLCNNKLANLLTKDFNSNSNSNSFLYSVVNYPKAAYGTLFDRESKLYSLNCLKSKIIEAFIGMRACADTVINYLIIITTQYLCSSGVIQRIIQQDNSFIYYSVAQYVEQSLEPNLLYQKYDQG